MFRHETCKLLFATALMLLSVTTMAAALLPAHYPGSFDNTGYLNSASLGQRILDMEGLRYKLSPLVSVHTLNKKRGTVLGLKKGTPIGITLDKNNIVTDIWILPKGYSVNLNAA